MMKKMLMAGTVAVLMVASGPVLARGMGAQFPDFAALDANGDGRIVVDEMTAYHAARLAGADADKDGLISVDEMVAMMAGARPATDSERVQRRLEYRAGKMIRRMDANRDGKLAIDEMARPDEAQRHAAMIRRGDADGDGALSQQEFDTALVRMSHGGEGRGMRGKGHHRADDHNHHKMGGRDRRGQEGCDGMQGARGDSMRRGATPGPQGGVAPPPQVMRQPYQVPAN